MSPAGSGQDSNLLKKCMVFLADEHWSYSRGTTGHIMPPPKGPLRDKKSPGVPPDEGKCFHLLSLTKLLSLKYLYRQY